MHTIKAYDHRGLVSTAKDVNSHAMCTQILPQVADVRWVGVCSMTGCQNTFIAPPID